MPAEFQTMEQTSTDRQTDRHIMTEDKCEISNWINQSIAGAAPYLRSKLLQSTSLEKKKNIYSSHEMQTRFCQKMLAGTELTVEITQFARLGNVRSCYFTTRTIITHITWCV